MYSDAVKTTGNEGKIEVRDLIQLIAEAVGLEAPTMSARNRISSERGVKRDV